MEDDDIFDIDPYDDVPPKEEPDCICCMEYGWVEPWGIRHLLARLGEIGRLNREHGRGYMWPCPGCQSTRLDTLLAAWRWRRFRRGVPIATVSDEPPF